MLNTKEKKYEEKMAGVPEALLQTFVCIFLYMGQCGKYFL